MEILSIKANSHSWSHWLALKNHKSGQDYSGDCVTLSPPYHLRACHFLVNFPSLLRNILYFFRGQGQIGSAPKSSWRQKLKIILRAMHTLYVCVPLASSEKRTRYCVQPRTGWAIFSLFCFVAGVLIVGGSHLTQNSVCVTRRGESVFFQWKKKHYH